MNGFPSMKVTMLAVMMAYASAPTTAFSEEKSVEIDKVEVRGILPEKLESVPGSYSIVDEKELEARRPFSIKEALSGVSGLNIIQNEDPLGLAQNIGLRGMDPRRSSRTLLLEDGMPLYLAPYGDPSSHYIPMLERVQRIEVVKGSGQVLYGPQTVGGMINFVTRPIPKDGVHGTLSAMAGNNDFTGFYANIGAGGEMGGVMLDISNKKGDGIRENHQFEVTDVTLKGQLNINEKHTLTAKVGTYQEHSNVSETGLGTIDYARDKFQAPSGKNDAFEHDRKFAQLQHIIDISDNARLTTQAYYVDSYRSSFRQTDTPGGYDDEEVGQSTGITVMDRCSGLTLTEATAEQCGGRHRPRHYTYYGVEPRLDFKHNLFGIESEAVVGFRLHQEDIKRQQFRDDNAAAQNLAWAKGRDFREDIRIEVESKSYYAQNTFHLGDFAVTPGVRVEDMQFKTKVNRAGSDPQNASVTNQSNRSLAWFGLAWNGIANTTVFAGVHKGFAPPRPDRDLRANGENTAQVDKTAPETSLNWELGVRSKYFKGIGFESTLFHTKFEDIVVRSSAGNFDNAGKAVMTGIEFAGRVDFGQIFNTAHNFYAMANYTNLWTAKFDSTSANAFSTVNGAGEVETAGDGVINGKRLPYAPKHMASVNFGYQHPVGIDARIGLDYISKQEVDGPFRSYVLNAADPSGADATLSGLSGDIPSYTLFNASVNFKPVGSKTTYFLSGHNLTDKEYLASRVDGMSAGRGRQVFGGVRFDF